MKRLKPFRILMATILAVLAACTPENQDLFLQGNEIKLTSQITPEGRTTDQNLQSTVIAEGQQVGVTILGATQEHTNVCWAASQNGTLINTGASAQWANSDVTVRAYHPYQSDWTGSEQTFFVQTDQSTDKGYLDSDLLWATTTTAKTNEPVALNFTHKLSKINVTLTSDGNSDLSKATITLRGVNIATGFNPETGELFDVEEKTADIKASVTTESAYTASAIIVPQTMKGGSQFIKITIGEEDFDYILPEDQVFESGQAYHYTLKVKLDGESVGQTDYVDLKFGMSGVSTSYNAGDGSLTMTYPSGGMPSVQEGTSIVLPEEYGFGIRVVESVSISGNTLSMKTSQGNMGNLFRNTSFTLTTDPVVASRSAHGDNIYTPSAFGYVDENGKYHELYNEDTDARAAYPIEQFKWEFKEDYSGEKIYEGKAGTLSWDKCEFSAGVKGTFTFDFGQKQITEVRAVGDLKRIDYKITGNIDMDMLLHYNYEYEYKKSGDEIIKYNAIPMCMLTFRVPIGGVPVPIHLQVYTHLGKMYACQVEGKLDATAGVKMGTEVNFGVEWTPETGAQPINEVKPYLEFHPLTVEAEASAEAKVSYYPQWEIGVYGFKAIWLEPRPYLKEMVEAGFRASTDGENHVGWKAETYNGMDLRMGLETDFGFWRNDVWTSDIYNVVKDQLLFEAPSRITTLSPENNTVVEKGENVTVDFLVESFSPITNKYYPCPLALINFEPECGELDKPLAVTNAEGEASVVWTPSPESNASTSARAAEMVEKQLIAKVVDKEGKAIDEANLIVKTEKDDELREALIKLYQSTNGDNWTNNENWCSEKPIEEWYGVNYDSEKMAYNIYLMDNNLCGKIDQAFPGNVYELDVYDNQLTSLNVSGSTALESLLCHNNQLTSMNVSGLKALIQLSCDNNLLTELDVSGCTVLEHWSAYNNPLVSLNVSGTSLEKLDFDKYDFDEFNTLSTLNVSDCKALKWLDCRGCQLTSLNASNCILLNTLILDGDKLLTNLDVSGCTALESLLCEDNQLTFLDVSGCTALESLLCEDNQLTFLDVSGCTALESLLCGDNQLTSLDVSGCTALESLGCGNNQLTSLDVSGCTALRGIEVDDNPLTSLNFSGCVALEHIGCKSDQLNILNASKCISLTLVELSNHAPTSLVLSECTALKELIIENNQVISLDVSGCTALESLHCSNTQLSSLNISGCTALKGFTCDNTQLTSLDVSGFKTLESLTCENNTQLISLNVSSCTALGWLNCDNNTRLKSLNISGCTALSDFLYNNNSQASLNASKCTALTSIGLDNKNLTSIDVSGCTALEFLSVSDNPLTSLNASGCDGLKRLSCNNTLLTSLNHSGCTALKYLDCNNTLLSSLNVSNHTALETLSCKKNEKLRSLDVSGCKALPSLDISNSLLTSLNASGCKALRDLNCSNNQLTSLNVSGCTALESLSCHNNQLTSLNVSSCTALRNLHCENNQLTSLNVSGCTALTSLDCGNNRITSVIPDWFSQLSSFGHDVRYRYYEVYIDGEWVDRYEDRGIGWWYPGEPGKHEHSPD